MHCNALQCIDAQSGTCPIRLPIGHNLLTLLSSGCIRKVTLYVNGTLEIIKLAGFNR